jgi:hypothetical protein
MTEFQIRKNQFHEHRLQAANAQAISAGEILLKVDRFAYTANNITYAATGDTLGYWQFFPPSGADAQHWGMTPVWGFADVIATQCPDVPLGERLFGYFPPATQLKMRPENISAQRLFDGSAHRSTLPPGYNRYSRVRAEVNYAAVDALAQRRMDNARMLLWPLHLTSFCLLDLLQQHQYYGAQQIIILSASSKTSIGLAYGLASDAAAPPVLAATSARNCAFVQSLEVYARTYSYTELAAIDASVPSVMVDMSGNADYLGQLHAHLGAQLRKCINVGMTHWEDGAGAQADARINRARSEFFFGPAHVQQRMADWGAEGFAQKSGAFLLEAARKSQRWLKIEELAGLEGLAGVYGAICKGETAPELGLVITMP